MLRPEFFWFLNVCIAHSAAFTRWLCVSTSFILMLSSSRYFLTDLEATLSMILKTYLDPLFVKYAIFFLKFSIVDESFKSFTGIARIKFDYHSYKTNMDVFPSIDLIGYFPENSTYMVPSFGFIVAWYANGWLSLSVVISRYRYLFVLSISNTVLIFSLVLQFSCCFFSCGPCLSPVPRLGDIFGLLVLWIRAM